VCGDRLLLHYVGYSLSLLFCTAFTTLRHWFVHVHGPFWFGCIRIPQFTLPLRAAHRATCHVLTLPTLRSPFYYVCAHSVTTRFGCGLRLYAPTLTLPLSRNLLPAYYCRFGRRATLYIYGNTLPPTYRANTLHTSPCMVGRYAIFCHGTCVPRHLAACTVSSLSTYTLLVWRSRRRHAVYRYAPLALVPPVLRSI